MTNFVILYICQALCPCYKAVGGHSCQKTTCLFWYFAPWSNMDASISGACNVRNDGVHFDLFLEMCKTICRHRRWAFYLDFKARNHINSFGLGEPARLTFLFMKQCCAKLSFWKLQLTPGFILWCLSLILWNILRQRRGGAYICHQYAIHESLDRFLVWRYDRWLSVWDSTVPRTITVLCFSKQRRSFLYSYSSYAAFMYRSKRMLKCFCWIVNKMSKFGRLTHLKNILCFCLYRKVSNLSLSGCCPCWGVLLKFGTVFCWDAAPQLWMTFSAKDTVSVGSCSAWKVCETCSSRYLDFLRTSQINSFLAIQIFVVL